MSRFTEVDHDVKSLEKDQKGQRIVYFRVTGKQSVERLEPLFGLLSNASTRFEAVATEPDFRLVDEVARDVLSRVDQLRPLVVWETTCEMTIAVANATSRNPPL